MRTRGLASRWIKAGGVLLLGISFIGKAAVVGQIPVGKWRAHVSYNRIRDITGSDRRIFAAAENGLLIYHKEYHNLESLTSVTALNDVPISSLAYSPDQDLLMVGYRNGNLDIRENGKVSNYSSIKDHNLYPNKTIHEIDFRGNTAYMACSFGVAVFDLDEREFRETLQPVEGMNTGVYSVDHSDEHLFAATGQGLYYAPLEAPDLYDPSSWNQITGFPGYTRKVTSVRVLNGQLVFAVRNEGDDDELYQLAGLSQSSLVLEADIVALDTGQDRLYVSTPAGVHVFDGALNPVRILDDYVQGPTPTSVYYDQADDLWLGDAASGLIHYTSGSAETLVYNGPLSDSTQRVKALGEQVIGITGKAASSLNGQERRGALYRFAGDQWSNDVWGDFNNFVDVLADPERTARFFAATWGDGLLEIEGGKVVHQHDQDNSPLVPYSTAGVRVNDLCYDGRGNLWLSNYGAENPIRFLDGEGNWYTGEYELLRSRLPAGLVCDDNGYIWGYIRNQPLVFVIDPGNAKADPADDRVMVREVLNFNGKSFAESVVALEKDREGRIWIATDEGIAVDYEPGSFFTRDDYRPNRIRMTFDGYTQYVLRDNSITDIGVDPGNRKWLSTENAGVFVISPDAQSLEHHFTSTSSPLLSDSVRSTAVTAEGEVFFATARGICSYRSKVAEARDDFRDAYVFPNPVRPGYDGPITITNLVEDVNIKITDVAGNLVYETMAEGGQAVWDGRNLSGRRVGSGVYLIFMTNQDGSKTHVGKLLFIK